MPIKVYATDADPAQMGNLKIEEGEILATLGPREDAVAVQLQELFDSVANSISSSVIAESKLTIEITGAISLKAQGTLKYLFFNVGGDAGSSNTMKVTLSTTLNPKS